MEFRQLRYFIAVAEELHFGRAAERLQITRPPLSQQILALERELGVELFVRGRRIELTEAGRVLLEQGRCADEAVAQAAQAAREAGEGTTRLRIGYPAAVASQYAPTAVRTFRERFPSVALETVVGHTGAHLMALKAKQVDVAFVRLACPDGEAISFRPLHRERVFVAMPEGHPLARLRAVRAEHIAHEPVVLFPRALDPPLHDHLVNEVCDRSGVLLSVALEATTLESSLGAVAAGLGLTFTAESAVGLFKVRGVAFRPLMTTAPALQVGVTWRRDAASRAVRQFLAVIDELARGARLATRDDTAYRHNGHDPDKLVQAVRDGERIES
ncbi:MAG TPA: LysR family transcriptional regulator [Actinomycetes bacterium]|jgi:DNA-binding transcriptional LysR family regulator|nr:LysR family transcriptional regulator [Actinomycetes bacterium]